MSDSYQSIDSEVSITSLDTSLAFDQTENSSAKRFTRGGTMGSLLLFAVGPLLTTLRLSLADTIDLMEISSRFKDQPELFAVQTVGFCFTLVMIPTYLASFFHTFYTSYISLMLGEGRKEEASQVITDVIRIAAVVCFVVCMFLSHAVRPILKFVGCTDDLIDNATYFANPMISATPVYVIFHLSCGYLQSIGKPILCGIVHVIAGVVQCGVISPLLLFGFKVDIIDYGLSPALSISIVGLVLIVLIYKGKFNLKPKWGTFFNPLSPETYKAFKQALPMLLTFTYALIPPTLFLRFMTQITPKENINDYAGVFTVFQKLLLVCVSVPSALCSGFVSTGSHAYGSNDLRKLLSLFTYTISFVGCFIGVTSLVPIFMPDKIVGLFISTESTIELSKKMLPIPFYTYVLHGWIIAICMFLVCVKKPIISMLPYAFQLILQCVLSKLLAIKYDKEKTPYKIFITYNISDGITFAFACIVVAKPLYDVIKKVRAMGPIDKRLFN